MSDRHRYDALVLDASARQSLLAVRSLGRRGLRVAAGGAQPQAPAFASRHCAARIPLPDVEANADAYMDALLEQLRGSAPRAILTAHDGTIEALRRRRPEVERLAPVAMAPEAPLDVAVSKPKTLAAAVAADIPVPRGVEISDPSQIDDALAETGLPAVLKPVVSWVGTVQSGVRLIPRIALTRGDVVRAVEQALSLGTTTLLQTWLSGAREAVSVLYSDGTFPARFAQVAHRMNPPLGGMSVLRESIPLPPDITDATERLIQSIELEGYSEVEFRRDASGRAFLMEINPRLSASVEVAERSGVPFPQLMFDWVTGTRVRQVARYSVGVRMRWLSGEIRWLRNVVLQQGRPDVPPLRDALCQQVRGFRRGTHYDYADRDDPGPAFAALRGFATDVVSRSL